MFSNFIGLSGINESWSVTSTEISQRYRDYSACRFVCKSLMIFGTNMIYQTAVGSFQISELQTKPSCTFKNGTHNKNSSVLCSVPQVAGQKLRLVQMAQGAPHWSHLIGSIRSVRSARLHQDLEAQRNAEVGEPIHGPTEANSSGNAADAAKVWCIHSEFCMSFFRTWWSDCFVAMYCSWCCVVICQNTFKITIKCCKDTQKIIHLRYHLKKVMINILYQ